VRPSLDGGSEGAWNGTGGDAGARLCIDETAYLKATPTHPTLYATGLVDLDRPMIIDMVEGNTQLTYDDGARLRTGGGWPASPRWPPTWPSPTGLASTRTWPMLAGWPTRST
jgi:hypothetical protein